MKATLATLAPGSAHRPPLIDELTWARMPWPSRVKAARNPAFYPKPKPPRRLLAPAPDLTEHQAEARRLLLAVEGAAPCGTRSAAARHRANGEKPCTACIEAERADGRRRWQQSRRRGGRRTPQPCGTRAAYKRHVRRGEQPCDACRAAQVAYSAHRRAIAYRAHLILEGAS